MEGEPAMKLPPRTVSDWIPSSEPEVISPQWHLWIVSGIAIGLGVLSIVEVM